MLLQLHQQRALDLLVAHVTEIPIDTVVSQLQSSRKLLHLYLDVMFKRDPQLCKDFQDLQVCIL